ncbi:MAG: hypothetical protein ACI4QX_05520 [Lachnospiraceae bacterium]
MDKTDSEQRTEQDEELYALLEKAMSEERLCVSEELIQKTLQRAGEAPSEKPHRTYFTMVRYACAAAAALLVIVLGGGILRRGVFGTKNGAMESAPQSEMESRNLGVSIQNADAFGSGDAADTENNSVQQYSNGSGIDGRQSMFSVSTEGATLSETVVTTSTEDEAESVWQATTVVVSEELAGALAAAGYTVSGQEARYWRLTSEAAETDWEQEILSALYETKRDGEGSDDGAGSYQYRVLRDGEADVITSRIPLYAAVRTETEQGILWILLGKELYLLTE